MEDTAGDNTFLRQAKAAMTERFQVSWTSPKIAALSNTFVSM
jgi:hypothetical protein